MVKNILLLVVLIPALVLADSGPILLGTKDDAKITLTYLERDKGDALKVKFDVATGDMMQYNRAYVAICCHTPANTNPQQGEATQEGTTQEGTTQEGTTKEGTTQTGTTQEGTTQEGTTQEGTTQEGTTQDGQAEQDQTSTEQTSTTTESTNTDGAIPISNGGSGNGRNLKAADGQCFAVNFNCIVKTGCKNALDVAVNLFASQVNSLDQMVWQEATLDLSAANIGASGTSLEGEYHTRYRFNQEDAVKSNIPLLNEEAHLTCYTAFNVSYTGYELDKMHNLKDTKLFPVVTNAIVAATETDLTEDQPTTESIAIYNFIQISVFGLILAVLNTF